MIKVIKNEKEYEDALAEISTLIDRDPDPGAPEADRLELLTLLVENYESQAFPKRVPDPLEAIRFRMEQQNLKQRDLVPYMGSPGKVSEVLSGRRPLTLSMMRALHSHLGIPASVLLRERKSQDEPSDAIPWERFPLKEMIARGWITGSNRPDKPEALLTQFFAPVGSPSQVAALFKTTETARTTRSINKYSLAAWTARIIIRAREKPPKADYKPDSVDLEFMQEIARLSWSESGPRLAQEFLRKHGIPLIIEPHLTHTHLDGAAIMYGLDRPIIGLTIRHDRLDNFWYCLMHELAHVSLHYGQGFTHFFDNLDVKESNDPREQEADRLAGSALIPEEEWNKSPAKSLRSPEAAQHLARKLRIHPAIVAGRMRHEAGSYKVLNQIIGQGKVRQCFPEISWSCK
ncbi:MAG: ImmA/IrrE family metallo-endopeptidase [Pyrinomonadaceae bacterium]|nr:ImmA/IrrE family metallo-endopeptidase [Pyrinomonadaceae bacterium]